MIKEIFEPSLCCSSGVCGPEPMFAVPLQPSEIIGIEKVKRLSAEIFKNN
jgi:hypothetical protein